MSLVPEVVVLDYGSQFNLLITRRLREHGVFSELMVVGDVVDVLVSKSKHYSTL